MKTAVIHLLEDAEIRSLLAGRPLAIDAPGGSRTVIAVDGKFDPMMLTGNGGARLEAPRDPERPKRKYTRRAKTATARAKKGAAVKAGRTQCPHCPKTFASPISFYGHRRNIHPEVPTRKRPGGAAKPKPKRAERSAAAAVDGEKKCACGHRRIAHRTTDDVCMMPDCRCEAFT